MSQFRDSQFGDPKSSRESVGHQPPNQADLKRYPPVGAVCTVVRGWLRDFVDHDLDDRLRTEVEEHVHRCRTCSLALARAEHEALLLRDAFADERTRAGQARPRLIAQIVDAVRRDEIDESESRRRRRARRTLRPAGVAASVIAVVGISFGLALSGRWMAEQAPTEPKFVVVDVAGASFRSLGAAGGYTALELGSEFRGGVSIQTRTDGELEFVAFSEGSAPGGAASGAAGGARFFLGGGSDLQSLPDAGWELRSGELHVDSDGPVSVRLGESGSLGRVEFDAGAEAWLSIEDVRRPDRLAVGAVTPTEPRSRVEVLHSVGAGRLFRGSSLRSDPVGADALVADALVAGRTVEWLPGGPLEETFASTSAVVAASLAARNPGVAAVSSTNGQSDSAVVVTGPDGRPAADVLVSVETASGRVEVRSDTEGLVRSRPGLVGSDLSGSGLSKLGQRALVSVSTRPGQGLASTSPRLVQDGEVTKGPLRIELAFDRPVSGRLLDVDGSPMARAVVVPLLVDELFQRVARLEKLAVSSGADGVFRLEGLPAEFEPFQTLAVEILPLERQDRAVPFVAPIVRDRSELQTLRRPASRDLRVEGLQPGAVVRVLESIPGLPAEVLAVRHDLVVRSDGGATFRSCGLGELFAVDAESSFDDGSLPLEPLAVEGRLLVTASDSVAGTAAAAGVASTQAQTPRSRSQLAAIDLVSGGGSQLLFRPGRRSGALYSPPDPDAALAPILIEEPASLVGSGQVHLERADGGLEVVGRTGFIGLQIERPTLLPYRLTAVWSDGSIARASIQSPEQSLQLAVVRPGSIRLVDGAADTSPIVDFDPQRSGGVSLRLRCLDGAAAGCEFFRSVEVGGDIVVPAGRYRVSIGDLDLGELSVGSGVEVRLPIVR